MDQLLVADSFRVRRGVTGRAEVRGFTRHLERFQRSVRAAAAEAGREDPDLDAFFVRARAEIERFGDGFPRLEYRSTGELRLTLRELPELTNEIDLTSAPTPLDAASAALSRRKGPNLERYLALSRTLGTEGALLSSDGAVIEGTTTSLAWWGHMPDGRALLQTSSSPERVESVTERMLLEIAEAAGHPHQRSAVTPAQLATHEVWAVNALHGIRKVRRIDGITLPAPEPNRLHEFRSAFEQTWECVLP